MSNSGTRSVGNWLKGNAKFILGIVVSLLFLYLAFGGLQFDKVFQEYQRINSWYLLLAVGFFFMDVFWVCIRWSYQLHNLNIRKDLKVTFPITPISVIPSVAIGYFANNIFPARAGEFFRTFSWCKKTGMGKSVVLATVVVERIFDGLAMVTLAVVSSFFIKDKIDGSIAFVIQLGAFIFLGILVFAFLMLFFPKPMEKILDSLVGFIPHTKIQDSIKHIYHSFIDAFKLLPNFKSVGLLYFFSLMSWLFEGLVYMITAKAFGFDLPVYAFIFTAAFASLWTLIPSTPGYAGTFDFAVVKAMGLFAVSASVGAGYTILLHLVLWLPITLIGAFFAWREGVKKIDKVVT
ncbi:MAG: lysylphosphatidylglycerol synthase transmembrane domain-containing protein [bacterium]